MAIVGEKLLMFEEYLKRYTPVYGAVDFEFFKPFIIVSQDTHIESYIGTDLMDKIKTDAIPGPIAGVYATLLDGYIRKALMWWTVYEAYPFLTVKMDNGSVVVRTSDDTTQPDQSMHQSARSSIRNRAEFYSKKLTDYLCANSASFPEYSTNTWPDKSPMGAKTSQVPMSISRGSGRHSGEGIGATVGTWERNKIN